MGIADEASSRRRLADLMDARRLELRLRWRDVAAAGGLSYEALRSVRNRGSSIRGLTKRGIEIGLQWEPGSVDAVLAGGDPLPASAPASAPADHQPAGPLAGDGRPRYSDPDLQAIADVIWEEPRLARLDPGTKRGMIALAAGMAQQERTQQERAQQEMPQPWMRRA